MDRQTAIEFLLDKPHKYGHILGFTKLGELHRDWIVDMVRSKEDETLQGSRGTYKTTCVSVALSLIAILLPNKRTLFCRKTDGDVKEVVRQVQKILRDPHTMYFVNCIYGVDLKLTTASATEIMTNLTTDLKGTNQLVGIGTGSSITGKHFDYIFTDDIVNVSDRISKADREKTKTWYQELQNVKNRDGGRIFNSGTPWHPEDAFTLMPEPKRYNCYHPEIQKIISREELAELKTKMLPSLFAANYELRHIASENVIFTDPKTGGDPELCKNGLMHLDSAFYGEDFTAWSVMNRHGGKYYLYGQLRRKHVEDCYELIKADYNRFLCGKLLNESNADKGMVGKDLRKTGVKVILYHESMNKYMKIVTYLKAIWQDLVFVEGTDPEYIRQITDYFEDAEHDDAPDSAASLARTYYKKADNSNYTPIM